MEYNDYYKVLGIKRDATQDEIKRAYRKLARQYHPDVNNTPDAEKKFKLLNEANEVLKDPEKRAAYDKLGADWKDGQEFKPPPSWNGSFEFSGGGYTEGNSSGFSDFFASLFGRKFNQTESSRTTFRSYGEDHHAKVFINLEDSFHGATRNITLSTPELDNKGHLINRERTLKVRIPKGVKQGQLIRLTGQGGGGMGEVGKGDLYLEVEFKPHRIYHIEDRDIYLDLPVAPWEAALGGKVKVSTPVGVVDLKVPAGATSGTKLRLKERGIPANPPGDLYVVLQIVLPPANDDKSKDFYRKMERELAFNPRSGLEV